MQGSPFFRLGNSVSWDDYFHLAVEAGGALIKSVLKLFDYFKEAFALNRANKGLYGPQIALALVKVVLIGGFGFWAYTVVNGEGFRRMLMYGSDPWAILRLVLGAAGIGLLALVLWLLVVRLVEAGLHNMYKSAVLTGSIQPGSFWAGVAKFFLPFVLGDLVIALAVLLLSPIWVLLGLVTLTIGFSVGAIALGVLLMFWKVSLVWNQRGIFEAAKDSFRFAWRNFVAVTTLYLIRQAFANPFAGGGGGGNPGATYSVPGGEIQPPVWINPESIHNILRMAIAIATPALTIIVAISSLIQMIFTVFFALTLFVTYKHGFRPEEEVNPDVV